MPRAMNTKQTQRKPRKIKNRSGQNGRIQGASSAQPSTLTARFAQPVHCVIPRGPQLFPDTFTSTGKIIIELGMSGAAASQHTYHLNSPAKTFGPQVNWTGAFADNVPAGMSYLLSSNTVAGSTAPYFYCCTERVDWEYQFININTIGAYVTILPSFQVSLSGMTQSQLAEQRGAVQTIIPASQGIIPPVIRGSYSVQEVFGTTTSEVLNNSNYRQTAGALPPISMYLHLIVASVDGTTSVAMQTKATFWPRMHFSTINSFSTTVPT